jgi:hypothetical protein
VVEGWPAVEADFDRVAQKRALNYFSEPRYSALRERLISQPTFLSARQAKLGPEKE